MALLLVPAGCGSPSQVNIDLRKENQHLREQIAELNHVHAADLAVIRTLAESQGRVDTLAPRRQQELFTVHGLSFGRLTGGADLDPDKPGDEVLKVYVVPTDKAGDVLKAAGSFTVEAFDLDRESERKIGQWEFPLDQAERNWYGKGMLYTYVLTCPWQAAPEHRNVTIQVRFLDALTQRTFVERKEVQVSPPPATRPSAQ